MGKLLDDAMGCPSFIYMGDDLLLFILGFYFAISTFHVHLRF
jgi:hypothetical protein